MMTSPTRNATESVRLERRPLGKTGLAVTPLALADLSFRDDGLPRQLIRPHDVERAFHELGINTFFVTWQMKGLSEGVRRLVKAGHRDQMVIISVGSLLPFGLMVRRAWENNARALGIDHIDVWLMGWVRGRWHLTGKTWPVMQRLKEQGKARAIGFSCHNRPLAVSLAREFGADTLMIRYNAAHRGAEREVFSAYGQDRPAIISYTATRWRMLLKPLPAQGFPQAMTGPECYRFVLSNPSIDVALCAGANIEELRENVAGVLKGPLDQQRMDEAKRFGDAVHATARYGGRWMFRQG
jgi:aryl-alcohol dehydrogenase-like predicted oxidoreductase